MPKRKAEGDLDNPLTQNGFKSRKSLKTDGEQLIDTANRLTAADFQNAYIPEESLIHTAQIPRYEDSGDDQISPVQIAFHHIDQLDSKQLDTCLDLIASTSQNDYETSTFGWHPRRKRREMRDKAMRYLLVRSPLDHRDPASGKEAQEIQGFLSFMLTHDSQPSVPVLYVYEIHLRPTLRKCGLGAHLMRTAELIARKAGVEKVMLTCFVSNVRAWKFYAGRGYVADACSPGSRRIRGRDVQPDYVILSKAVAPAD